METLKDISKAIKGIRISEEIKKEIMPGMTHIVVATFGEKENMHERSFHILKTAKRKCEIIGYEIIGYVGHAGIFPSISIKFVCPLNFTTLRKPLQTIIGIYGLEEKQGR